MMGDPIWVVDVGRMKMESAVMVVGVVGTAGRS